MIVLSHHKKINSGLMPVAFSDAAAVDIWTAERFVRAAALDINYEAAGRWLQALAGYGSS